MTYIVTSTCVDVLDTACLDVCPVDCIYFEEGVDRMVYIAPDECIDCAACDPVCPVNSIFDERDVPKAEEAYIPLNYDYFEKDIDEVRARLNEMVPIIEEEQNE